jgi:hypothetical protein
MSHSESDIDVCIYQLKSNHMGPNSSVGCGMWSEATKIIQTALRQCIGQSHIVYFVPIKYNPITRPPVQQAINVYFCLPYIFNQLQNFTCFY